jgi:uncharacterized membrane-anchored protein
MSLENNTESLKHHSDAERLATQLEREGVDLTNMEEVLKVAELLLGEDKSESEVMTIVEEVIQKRVLPDTESTS